MHVELIRFQRRAKLSASTEMSDDVHMNTMYFPNDEN